MTDLKVKWCIYKAPLSQMSQRRFTMINLPPADWKHTQAQIAAASKQSMHAGTHFTLKWTFPAEVNFIPPSAEPGMDPGTLGSEDRDLTSAPTPPLERAKVTTLR